MQKVRFTIEELNSNVRFIFWVCSISVAALIVSQVLLMRLEKKSTTAQQDWLENEAFITSFQNAFYTAHDVQFSITKEYATTIAQSMTSFEQTAIQKGPYSSELEAWKEALERILDSRGYNTIAEHDHQQCVGLSARLNHLVLQSRLDYKRSIDNLQQRIDLINLIILLLPVVLFSILIYTAIFANYGGEA